jgi:AcrR family transcriptional regulator
MPAPKALVKKPDRRVARTHRLLRDALIQLLREHAWDEITVQQVCERADVGRSTFYIHFADKEELLIGGFSELKEMLREFAAASDQPLAFTLALLEHTAEFQGVAGALTGTHTAQVVQRAFTALVVEMVEEDLARLAPPGPLRDATARYLAGAFTELLRWWGGWDDPRRRSTSAQIDETFRRLTMPVLRELQRAGKAATEG